MMQFSNSALLQLSIFSLSIYSLTIIIITTASFAISKTRQLVHLSLLWNSSKLTAESFIYIVISTMQTDLQARLLQSAFPASPQLAAPGAVRISRA